MSARTSHGDTLTERAVESWRPAWTPLWRPALAFGVAALLAAFAFWWVFVGFTESDDLFYARAAEGWLRDGLFLGRHHWDLRHVIVLPMALGFKLFGMSETTLVLPSMIYAIAFLLLLGRIAGHFGGWVASALVIALVGTMPVIAVRASAVATDVPEAFFVILSVWAWYRARCWAHEGAGGGWLFVLGGAAAGFAAITRETTAALIVFYLIAFLAGRGAGFRGYVLLALGFLAVVGADTLYLWAMSGDPLYRVHTSLQGVAADGPQNETGAQDMAGLNRFGMIETPRWIRPVAMLLIDQQLGLFFWVGVPAALWLAARGTGLARQGAVIFGGLAAVWLLVIGYGMSPWLYVISRYFIVCLAVGIPAATLLAGWLRGRLRWVAAALALLVIAVNLLLGMVSNTYIFAGEHGLVAAAEATPGVLHTDPTTAQSAKWLLERRGLGSRVSTAPPQPGDLYYFNARPRRGIPPGWPVHAPPAGWVPLDVVTVPARWTAPLARWLHLSAVLLPGIARKLESSPWRYGTYQVPAAP